MSPFLIPVLTVIGSFAGAWLAAHFALRRFYRERIWDRKAAAYTAIFEALHEMARWYDEHYEAEIEKYEMDQDESNELRDSYANASRTLAKRIAAETWILPQECTELVSRLVNIKYKFGDNWPRHLETGSVAIQDTVNRLRSMARRELYK
jgi:hypothetical protein